jgi:hypothetical protein
MLPDCLFLLARIKFVLNYILELICYKNKKFLFNYSYYSLVFVPTMTSTTETSSTTQNTTTINAFASSTISPSVTTTTAQSSTIDVISSSIVIIFKLDS